MTITPEECLKPTSEEEEKVKILERQIDDALRLRFVEANMRIRVTIEEDLNERVFKQLHDMYLTAGWCMKQGRSGGDVMEPVQYYLIFIPTV